MPRTTDGPTFPPRARGEIVGNAATVDARAALKIRETIEINRPRAELYAIWRDFSRLPEYLPDIESVTVHNRRDSHWVAKLPAGGHVEGCRDRQRRAERDRRLEDGARLKIPHAGAINFRDSSSSTKCESKSITAAGRAGRAGRAPPTCLASPQPGPRDLRDSKSRSRPQPAGSPRLGRARLFAVTFFSAPLSQKDGRSVASPSPIADRRHGLVVLRRRVPRTA
jgi:hypothetical protein